MKLKHLWTIIFPLIFITIVYYLLITIERYLNLPKIPFNLDFTSYVLIFIGIILIGSVFYLFDILGEGTPVPKQLTTKFITKKLVVRGAFKYTRNPFSIGMFLIFMGIGFYHQSYVIILFTIIMIIPVHLFIVHIEERDMEKRFGKAYLEYKNRVPRWLLKF